MVECKGEETWGKWKGGSKLLESERTICWELVNGLSESQEVSSWFGHLASAKTDVSRHNLSCTSDNSLSACLCFSKQPPFKVLLHQTVANYSFYIKIVTTSHDVLDFRQDLLGTRQQSGFHLNEKGNSMIFFFPFCIVPSPSPFSKLQNAKAHGNPANKVNWFQSTKESQFEIWSDEYSLVMFNTPSQSWGADVRWLALLVATFHCGEDNILMTVMFK